MQELLLITNFGLGPFVCLKWESYWMHPSYLAVLTLKLSPPFEVIMWFGGYTSHKHLSPGGAKAARRENNLQLRKKIISDGPWTQRAATVREERRWLKRREQSGDGHLRATVVTDTHPLDSFFYFSRWDKRSAWLTGRGTKKADSSHRRGRTQGRDAVPREYTICVRRRTGPRAAVRGGGG